MSADVHRPWLETLGLLTARWNIVFVHLGSAYPAAREAISPSVEHVISALDYLESPDLPGKVRLVTDLEALINPGAPSLGLLRERVVADRDSGAQIILLSRRPRIAFPTVPGSQVLWDAKLMAPPHYIINDELSFGEELTREGVPPDVVLESALRELGEVACASLDALIFEDGRESQSLVILEEATRDALLSAGMVVSQGQELKWSITEAQQTMRAALSNVLASMRHPQDDLVQVAKNCWVIERLVKQALRARAKALWGSHWCMELLSADFVTLALDRANHGTYPNADKLEDLRDPLEWLSLSETLQLREQSEVGSLGVNPTMWATMSTELLPVKDRVERSQLIRRKDSDTANRWVEVLSNRLVMSGSRSAVESFALAPDTQRELLNKLRHNLSENSNLHGDVEKDFLSLVLSTVKFIAHTLDTRPSYTAAFSDDDQAPLERALQDDFKAYLDMSDLAGRSAVEVSSIAGGRADVVLYLNEGKRYVTEVKRERVDASRKSLETAYLPQAVAYQSSNAPFGQLLVLDLTKGRDVAMERLDESIWVIHSRNDEGAVTASTVVAVVRGNRLTPSARKN
jgi:hypothetical protein